MPTNNSELGQTSLSSEPLTEQVFLTRSDVTAGKSNDDFERDLFLLRCLAMTEIEHKITKDCYVCSLSTRTLTYKGQLTPEQLYHYYSDLQAQDFTSYVALVHSRFSTNTFPSVRHKRVLMTFLLRLYYIVEYISLNIYI